MSDGSPPENRDRPEGNAPSPAPDLRPVSASLPRWVSSPKRFPLLSKLDEWVTPEHDPTSIVYQHSVLCQTFLPYRDPGEAVRVWERSNGFLNLKLVAGDAADPDTGRWLPMGLPYGPKARLVLYHLNAEALRTRSPVIELAASLTKFVRHTLALSNDGRTIATVKDQLTRLAAADFRVQVRSGVQTLVLKSAFMDRLTLWASRDGERAQASPSEIRLSPEYFQSLVRRAVPLNESAVWCLSHNALAMDLYGWFAQRLHRIDPERGAVLVPWPRLHEQFGAGYARLRKFREVLQSTLCQVSAVYPQAKVALDGQGLWLRHSRPPVARRRLVITG